MNLEELNDEKKLKIVYMGTPDFSATVLKGLLNYGFTKCSLFFNGNRN